MYRPLSYPRPHLVGSNVDRHHVLHPMATPSIMAKKHLDRQSLEQLQLLLADPPPDAHHLCRLPVSAPAAQLLAAVPPHTGTPGAASGMRPWRSSQA